MHKINLSAEMNPCNILLSMKLSQDELRKLFERNRGLAQRNAHLAPGGVVATPINQSPVCNRPVGKKEGEGLNPGRRLVRIKSYRVRLLDERNCEDKYFTDALQYAGILYSDSPKWCKVEVEQVKVGDPAMERTVIEVSEME